MSRILAFVCFGCVAFAWVPPFIDRLGLAALGLGFLSWSVGRGLRPLMSLLPQPPTPAAFMAPEPLAPLTTDLADRIGEYDAA